MVVSGCPECQELFGLEIQEIPNSSMRLLSTKSDMVEPIEVEWLMMCRNGAKTAYTVGTR
jgi:hypothetical protein